MSTPALRAVRYRWPYAEITVLCLPGGEKVLRGSPRIDRFEIYDRKGRDAGLLGMRRLIRRVRDGEFELGIAMPNSFSSGWILKRARIPRRLGTDYGKRGWLLTDRFRPEMEDGHRVPKSMVAHYAELLASMNVEDAGPELELYESERGRRRARTTLGLLGVDDADHLVSINPGASFGPSKMWPGDRFAEVADRLQRDHGLKPLLIGGPGEEGILHQIAEKMETPALSTGDEVLDLDALKSAIRRSDLLVTTDTGPRHYGVALGVPTVVIMGPTDPRFTESNLDRSTVLRVEDLDCSPCHLKTCPLTHHRCMTWIEPDQVMAAAADLLARFPPAVTSEDE